MMSTGKITTSCLLSEKTIQILILDTDTLEIKFKIKYSLKGNDLENAYLNRCLTVPFLSLCKNHFAILLWMKQWRATEPTWNVATFKVHGLMTQILTLRQLARIAVLRSTKVANVPRLPLPEAMKNYLVN